MSSRAAASRRRLEGSGTTGNLVQGNFIGTNAAGATGLGNGTVCVVASGASGNTIGGTAAGAGNVIAEQRAPGVDLQRRRHDGQPGRRATSSAPTPPAPPAWATDDGVYFAIGASGNTIGGTAAGAGNVISGNSSGVASTSIGTTGNLVQGNFIGTNAAGAAALATFTV